MELTAEELRVLGCLIEKERTRPDDYPLTLNALVSACNQSTNRDPVVSYDELTVERALTGLREHGLARRGVYAGSRVPKHRHSVDEELGLDPAARSILAVLMLRGSQTAGELKTRTERLFPFDSLGAVEEVINRLAREPEPLVARLPRQPGQKEVRVVQLLTDRRPDSSGLGPVSAPALAAVPDVGPDAVPDAAPGAVRSQAAPRDADVAALRADIDSLRAELTALRSEFDAFRSQF